MDALVLYAFHFPRYTTYEPRRPPGGSVPGVDYGGWGQCTVDWRAALSQLKARPIQRHRLGDEMFLINIGIYCA